MRKSILIVATFTLASMLFIAEISASPRTDEFAVHKKTYGFATEFEIDSASDPATIVKSRFSLRNCYSLYDGEGTYQGYGACRLLCLGVFYEWATEIDVYDERGRWIGLIDGQVGTTAAAKFSIYNQENNRVGVAYLDAEATGFSILHPNSEGVIARYKRQFVPDVTDHWNVEIYNSGSIDLRILRIFGAFAVDKQSSFRMDI